jgi:membrane protein DedA with SNARE-associated domain
VQRFIASYGYAAVFVLMLAELARIPVPSEVIMLSGGALAAGAVAGANPSLAGIIAAGVAGNVAGSYLAWAAGRYWGHATGRRWAAPVRVCEHDIGRAAAWFGRYSPIAVFSGRLVPVVRTFISLPAGFARMPAGRSGAYTTASSWPSAPRGYRATPPAERLATPARRLRGRARAAASSPAWQHRPPGEARRRRRPGQVAAPHTGRRRSRAVRGKEQSCCHQ